MKRGGLLLWSCLWPAFAFAQAAPAAPDVQAPPVPAVQPGERAPIHLGSVVVTGRQPGPGLWQVRRGDHVLWILGTLTPVPRGIDWDAVRVEETIARSQQVLLPPSVKLQSDVGFFGRLTLIPTALKARRNPDGRTLQQLLSPAEYARWQVLKARYIGGDRGVEQWRPVFAALELFTRAIRRSGMTLDNPVTKTVQRAARRSGVPATAPRVEVKIVKAKAALKEFAATPLDDLDCLRRTIDRIEGDLGGMVARGNAWAEGDIDALRGLPYRNQFTACSAAFTEAALARKLGIDDIAGRIERRWTAEAEAALARNTSTFAVLPIAELLKPDGYLARLQAKGYVVVAPP